MKLVQVLLVKGVMRWKKNEAQYQRRGGQEIQGTSAPTAAVRGRGGARMKIKHSDEQWCFFFGNE
jgi:hypothetical protein